MAVSIDAAALKATLQRWSAAVQAAAPELNELDGRLGDGDLGATLDKCGRNVEAALPTLPATLDGIFKVCAQACAKASGSSFGTLLAVAFMTAAKTVADRPALDQGALAALLNDVVAALSTRGGAKLGDKTMLDSLAAIGRAIGAASDGNQLADVARGAAQQALDDMRGQANRIGRARMFAEKSIGLDDPGMVAVLRMTEAL